MLRARRRIGLLSFVALCVVVAGCLPFPGQTPAPVNVSTTLKAEYLVADAAAPAALALTDDGRAFYVEKNTGRIRVLVNGALREQPFAEVPVNSADDRGLLGIALHPDFAGNGRVYVFYTRSDSGANTSNPIAVIDNRVVYFVANGDVAEGGEVFVASFPAGGTTRVGGRLAFGGDRRLFVGLGDLGDAAAAQDDSLQNGKILRLNDDGSTPADNPTAGSAVFARGFREPRGLAFDPREGGLFVNDRGPNNTSEVSIVKAGGNYGWPQVAGLADTDAERQFRDENPSYADPILDTTPDRPAWVGASFDPSTRYGPSQDVALLLGVALQERVLQVKLSSDRTASAGTETFATGLPGAVTDVAFTPAGTLYIACEGAVLRVVPSR